MPNAMPCLTVRQPWALMLALGAKQFETRSWATTYRGPIALHAAKGITVDEVECCRDWPFRDALLAAGIKVVRDLPRGAVIATATLVDCIRVAPKFRRSLSEEEERMGDFTTGRFAWQFADMWRLPEPIPATGHLGLWQWMPPQCPAEAQKGVTTR